MKNELEEALGSAAQLIIGLGTVIGYKIIELVDRIPDYVISNENKNV